MPLTIYNSTLHPGIRWVKVVNTEETESDDKTPKIVAIAQWAIFEPGKKYPEVPDLIPEEHWANETEKDWGLDLWESYIQPRRAVLEAETEHPVVSELSFLAILIPSPRRSRSDDCRPADFVHMVTVPTTWCWGNAVEVRLRYR